ncbi:recombinase family protein [Pseudarthrobacter sp. HLT3-5]|uniref:recombinase family protein n=1 Tax=Pseudarthrobacter cellobiosi TaxID=2953654 RepID=UPI00208DE7B2|nr:recombinase family protein [Pseudarthrobacter sp. HLT3-5]MCO4276041.1 recombinase family protein [Pseudarthrobacter sp. HLT3-5]
MNPKNLLVREYLRRSKDRSGKGKSPDQQHAENAAALAQQGWDLHPEPYRDNDRSASRYSKQAREGFARLMMDLEEDTFGAGALGLWESSRGSRRTGEWVDLIELCEERGIRIWVTTHGRLYDPANARDRRSLLEDAVDSEYESAKTSKRLQRDMRSNAEKGRPHGKKIYGYRRIKDSETGALVRVEPHEHEASIVQEAARRVLAGQTFYAIAKDFNGRGIPPRRETRKEHRQGLGWTPPAVKQMLTMPAYAAKRQHQGEIIGDAMWPALIELETWEKLQIVMSPPERKRTNDWPAKHLLTGIAVCGVCGAPMRIGKQNAGRRKDRVTGEPLPKPVDDHGNELPYPFYNTYVCVGVPGKTGFHVAMRDSHLDEVVTDLVLTRLERPDFFAMIGERDTDTDAKRQAILAEIASYQDYLDRVREDAAQKLRFDLVLDQEARIGPKIKAAQNRLEKLVEMDPVVVRLVREGAARKGWAELDLPHKRRVLRAVATPRVNRVKPDAKGKRGINHERIDMVWH